VKEIIGAVAKAREMDLLYLRTALALASLNIVIL